MALAIFRASLDVSLVWPNDHLQVVPAEHAGENDAVGVLHHESIRMRPVNGPGRGKSPVLSHPRFENKTGTKINPEVRW
jgi:hypothetical protein